MNSQKDNLVYLRHIKDALGKIEDYISNHTENDFKENEWDQDAVMRNLEVIGEASARISDDFKKENHSIEWKEMKAMRNFLIHDYSEIDVNLVWQTISEDIPSLQKKILQVLGKS